MKFGQESDAREKLPPTVASWSMPDQVDWVLRQLTLGLRSQEWAKSQVVAIVRTEKNLTRMVALSTHIC